MAEETGALSKAITPKGGYAVPTPVGNIPVGADILGPMEALYQQKAAEQQGFMEAMKDAQAWWTAGGAERGRALSQRAQDRERQEQALFQIQTQLAQQKAALQKQREFERRRASGELFPGVSTETTAPTAASQMFGMPPGIRQAILNASTEEEAKKIFNDWSQKQAEAEASPTFDVTTRPMVVWDPERNDWTLVQASAREIRANPSKYFEPSAVKSKTPPSADLTAEDRTIPPAAAAPAAAAPAAAAPAAAAPAAAAPAAAAPAKAPVNYTFDELSGQQKQIMKSRAAQMGLSGDVVDRPDAAELFNKQPLERRKQVFASLGPDESVQPAKAPAVAARPPKPTPGEMERRAEISKQEELADIETSKKDFEAFQAATRPADVIDRMNTAKEVIDLVGKNRNAVGVFQQPGFASALGTILETGIKAPGGHSISIGDISSAIVKSDPNMSKNEIVARDRIESLLTKTALYASSVIKGQGQITEFERKLIEEMVGSVKNSPENLIKIQKTMLARAKYDEAMGEAFRSSGQTYKKFVRENPEYKRIYNQFKADVEAIRQEPLESQVKIPKEGTTTGGIKWRIVTPGGERK